MRSSLARRLRSFGYAARGFRLAGSGPNFRIQLLAAAAVLFLAVAYQVTRAELGLIIFGIAIVLSAELTNTAVERLCDFIAQLHGIGIDPRIRDIKDLAAAAVLMASLGAAAIGVTVFVHRS